MAGNVKEWCLNETTGKRYILGGAWNEPEYMFSARDAQRPFGRAETYGFRCARYPDPLSEELTRPIAALYHDFSQEKPVKDDIFEIYENLYSYDPINLDARIEGVDESPEHWRKETVSFNAAYGEERMLAHLYLPKNAAPPYQVVIYFPGINALNISVSENLADMAFVDFIPRCGRAFLYPVYKGTYERGGGKPARGPRAFRNRTIQRGKDIQRSIDYLESREDIDTEKIAYFGMSWGAFEGPIFTAIEKRFKVSILLGGEFYTNLFLSGGLYYDFMRREAEVNPIHFAPRSRLPVLMINGRYDFMFPVATSIVPMFRLQGAPEKDKRLALFDYGHLPPLNEVIRETLDWLDHHLGAVQSEMQNIK